MKKILLTGLLIGALFGNDENHIELGFGYMKSKDNFSTESKSNITQYTKADSEGQAMPYIDLFYGYKLNNSANIYTSLGYDGLKLGSEIMSNYGMFDFGLKADLIGGEEWENPFLTNSARKKTDTKEFGAYITYGLPILENMKTMLTYEYSNKSYDKETVQALLKREGKRHIVALDNMFENGLMNRLSYEKYKADGKASAYTRYDFELGYQSELTSRLGLFAMLNAGKKDYDEKNPVFNKTIDSTIYGIKAGLTYDKPFDYENTYVSFKTGYEREDANVDFYDKDETFGVISFGYKF